MRSYGTSWAGAAAAVVLFLTGAAGGGEVVIDDFEGPVRWKHNPDGGAEMTVRRDRRHVRHGKAALRLTFRDRPPHWSNIRAPVTVPPDATAVALWLRVHSAAQGAAMHVWLLEADRDAWVSRIGPAGKDLRGLSPGWHEIVVPVGGFRFQPRGRGSRRMTDARTMLIGCNFADLDVTIDRLRFVVGKEARVTALPKTEELAIRRGKGAARSVAVLSEDLPRTRGAADPKRLAALASELGYAVTFLRAGDAADPAVLSTKNFGTLVVPCAPAYARAGKAALLGFLRAGGSMVSIGGYAFDRPLYRTPAGWADADLSRRARDMSKPAGRSDGINHRYGRPGDTMRIRPDQICAFDPAYLLKSAAYAATAPDQSLLRARVRIDGPLEGYAACAMPGSNSPVFPEQYGRWVPLLNAYDRLGRLRGAAGAVVHHWAGPFAGSSWALFGVTNRDLFADAEAGRALLQASLCAVTEKVYLHGLKTEFACYRAGERVRASVRVANRGREARTLRVRLSAEGREPAERTVPLRPGETKEVAAELHDGKFEADFQRVRAELIDKAGRQIDRMETAFVVWDEKLIGRGPKIAFKDNYFTLDGRPQLLCGTNQTGMMWHWQGENPLVWDRDFAKMRSSGLRMLRILHFSPFAAAEPRRWAARGRLHAVQMLPPNKKLLRQTDAIVQLAQKHGVAIFLSLHDWIPTELSDAELKAERRWNRFWADRYRDVPGILYDVQNEPTVSLGKGADVARFYNERLRERYKTFDALRAAWGASALPARAGARTTSGGEGWRLTPAAGSNDWGDIKTLDANRFRVDLLNRWVQANVRGIRAGDGDALVTVGYLQFMHTADKVLGARHLDFSNAHYHGPLERFAPRFKIIDRRCVGRGLSLGEFGAWEGHNARVRGQTGAKPDESVRRFLATTHWAFGLGASAVLNWSWKDLDGAVFPWGLNHHCDLVAKEELHAYRNTSLFLGRLRPRYERPAVWLLLPDSHRLGARSREIHAGLYRAIEALIACRVNFNVASEYDLRDRDVGAEVQAIVWPVPYCPEDACFERVRAFVRRGGALYVSGDVSYDALRRRTRTGRLAALGLKDVKPALPFSRPAGGPPPQVQHADVGKGKVFYVPRPVELQAAEAGALVKTLGDFLRFAGVSPIKVGCDDPGLHAFTAALADGRLTLVCNRAGRAQDVRIGPVRLTVAADLTGAVVRRGDGRIVAVECTGRAAAGDTAICEGDAHVMIQALDDRDVRLSKHLAVFPATAGALKLYTSAAWQAPVLDVGEPDGAGWRSLAVQPCKPAQSAFSVRIDADLARSILLLRERSEPARLGRRAASR